MSTTIRAPLLAALLLALAACGSGAPEREPQAPPPSGGENGEAKVEASGEVRLATFGGGCFWCVEAVFERVEGVVSARSGYAGGHLESPDYESVCTGETGHAEVVQIAYDPAKVSYGKLLEVFFATHDPTTPNRQGADVGTQYRSAIFTHDEEQAVEARAAIAKLEAAGAYRSPIVTEVAPLDVFHPAEDYHQDYFAKHPDAGYCRVVISPKVVKFQKEFEEMLRR